MFLKTHLDIKENRGLGDDLRLLGLLLMVSLQPLLRDPLLLLAFLLIGASKEVDVIVFLLSRSRLGGSRLGRSRLGGWFPTLELANARLQGEDQGLQVVRDCKLWFIRMGGICQNASPFLSCLFSTSRALSFLTRAMSSLLPEAETNPSTWHKVTIQVGVQVEGLQDETIDHLVRFPVPFS